MKNVIHIFGASGSGTTTLGEKISRELGYKHMDSDDYYWMPTELKYTLKRPIEERIALMTKDIERFENVVISSSLVGWGDSLIPYFTLAVRIDIAPELRIARLIAREKKRYGSRIDAGGDMHKQHIEFVEWARSYDTGGIDTRSKARHDAWQKLLACELLRIDGADTLEENFEKVKKCII
jgi:adenylate kinase family enzyme